MKNKMQQFQTKLEIRKAEKKGAASIETIIVSALLIALAVGLVTAFSKTLGDSGSASNKATATAVNACSNDSRHEPNANEQVRLRA